MTKLQEELSAKLIAASNYIHDYENITKENTIIRYICCAYISDAFNEINLVKAFQEFFGDKSGDINSHTKDFEKYYYRKYKIDLKLLIEQKLNDVEYIKDLYEYYTNAFIFASTTNLQHRENIEQYYNDLVTRTNRIEKLKELYE